MSASGTNAESAYKLLKGALQQYPELSDYFESGYVLQPLSSISANNVQKTEKATLRYSLLLILLIVVFPILYTAYISFTNMNVYHWFNFSFVGLKNYKDALFVFDSGFLAALLRTILWTVLNMVLQLVIAFVLASLLNIQDFKGRRVYKTLLMIPWAMPGYVSILLWKNGIFNSQFGLLNQWMQKLGLATVRWLANDVSAFLCCTVVNLWLALPFMIMIMDGALQAVDHSCYESAILDGANWFQRAYFITIPAIRPIIAPSVLILSLIHI